MGYKNNGRPAFLELPEFRETFRLKNDVAHRKRFVDQEDGQLGMHRDREAQPHIHSRRIIFYRRVDEFAEVREVDDGVKFLL